MSLKYLDLLGKSLSVLEVGNIKLLALSVAYIHVNV